ncbi:maestro heat-like repeat-containing protein family member 2B [Dromaius novaehollandiae]|uniref:maestro heat-like repeat-containing protein family member 2B n=1 Tax=Dromaius novaehollandiae TaxID=8790 RepID=UPI00311D779D
MRRLRALRGLFACGGCWSRPPVREDGGRAAESVPAAVPTFAGRVASLSNRLQEEEGDRAEVYRELERVLQGDDGRVQSAVLARVIAAASRDMRAAQGVTEEVRTAASDVLVALARCHFDSVMCELQCRLRALGEISEDLVFVTLGKLASSYALRCVPFVGMTLFALRTMLSQVGSSRTLRAVCSVLEQWSKAVNSYLGAWEQCSFPRVGQAQLCSSVSPLFGHAVGSWLGCEEEEAKQAVLGAMAAMMGLLVREEEHRERVWEQLPWLLGQYQQVQDSFRVTKALSYFLEILGEVQVPIPQDEVEAIGTAVHRQLSDGSKQHSGEHRSELSSCVLLLARVCPEDTVAFLRSQLGSRSEAARVVSLDLLGALVRPTAERGQSLPLLVQAVRCALGDPSRKVARAALRFTKELLGCSVQSCSAWDLVAHVFATFSQASGRLAQGKLSEAEAQEAADLQALCLDILRSLDVSVRGMTKLLWPRLLQYVVPAQYTGTLVPLCRCLRELAESRGRAGGEDGEEEPNVAASRQRAKLPRPQALLARLLVVAAAPHAGGGCGVAALRLLRALSAEIHGALGMVWAVKIPFLLQCLEGQSESCLDSAEWEQLLLKFLRTSLETIESQAWTVGLSLELSQQTGSYPRPSREQAFLYKAVGVSLAACRHVPYVRREMKKYLLRMNYLEVSEREAMISVVAGSAESHFHLALEVLQEFGASMEERPVSGAFKRLKEYHQGKRAGRHAALVLAYGRIALRAPPEQLLARVESDVVGRILRHYRASCQVLGFSFSTKDVQLKLALIRSVAEVSRAVRVAGGSRGVELCRKRELLDTLLGFVQGEPRDRLASPVRREAFVAVGHLSKLKPSLSREENRDLLDQCVQSVMPLPALEPAEEEGATAADAGHVQGLHARTMGALGELLTALLEEDLSSDWLAEMLHVLEYWLTSAKEWERERALQACAQLLGAFEERFELTGETSFGPFGSMVGLLAPFTCDSLATSCQRAGACLGHLLRIQGRTLETGAEEDEVQPLCQRLSAPDAEALRQASSRLRKIVCKHIPPAQATDFLSAALDGMLSAQSACAQAAGKWLLTFLETCGGQLLTEVPEILSIIYVRMPTMQQDTLRHFLLEAVSLLALYHPGAVIDSLLQKQLPMDSDTEELWRVLGGKFFVDHVLRVLMEKLKNSGSDQPRTSSAKPEAEEEEAALEPLKMTRAISVVVSALQSPEAVQRLLPELLPVLLKQISATVGKEMPSSALITRGKLFLKGHASDDNPCRLSLETLEAVLRTCLDGKWLRLLRQQGAWAALEDPRAHHDGVCLLTGVLLRAGTVSLPLVLVLTRWLDAPSANLRVTAAAFCAELMKEPALQEWRCLQPIARALLEKLRDSSSTVRQMAARGLGNLVSGAPEKLRKHKGAVLEALRRGLEDAAAAEVVAESLLALAKVVTELKGKAVGSAFRDIARATKGFFDAEQASLRSAAFTLYGVLAASATSRWRSFFTEELGSTWATLVLHLRDPDPGASMACQGALRLCAPFLGLRRVRQGLAVNTRLSAAELLGDVCSQLAQESPEHQEMLYVAARRRFLGSCGELQAAALDVAGVLVEHAGLEWLTREEAMPLSATLRVLRSDGDPRVQQAAARLLRDTGLEQPPRRR